MALHVVALDDYQGLVAEYRLDGQPGGAKWTASASTWPATTWWPRCAAPRSWWRCASGPGSTAPCSPGCRT